MDTAPRFRSAWLALPLAALALLAAQAAWAQASGVFSVRDFPVDVTADTSTAARERAVRDGQRRALGVLLRKLTRKSDHSKLPEVDDAQATAALLNFQVANERISSVRYLANLTFNFQPVEVRRILRRAGLPYAETPSQPVVVVPLLARDSELALWEERNLWRLAWAAMPKRDGLLPLVIPFGDLEDISNLAAQQAVAGEAAALEAFARRYGTTETAVVAVDLREDMDLGAPVASLEMARHGLNASDVKRLRIDGSPREPMSSFLARVAALAADALEDTWVEGTLLRVGAERQIAVSVPLAELAEWVDVRERLEQVAVVTQLRVQALRRDRVDLIVDVLGTDEQLRQALATVDLEIAAAAADAGPRGGVRNVRRIGTAR